MKKIILAIIKRFHSGFKEGVSEYLKATKKHDPDLTLNIFGFLGNIASGLWNGVRGAIGGFFGQGGQVAVSGAPPAPTIIQPPAPLAEKKDNTLLYVGIAVGVVIFVVMIIVLTGRK